MRLEVLFEEGPARGPWEVVQYSFHFQPGVRGRPWFRYERDPQAGRGLAHPVDQLHVDRDEPRYPIGRLEAQDILDLVGFLEAQALLGGDEDRAG